MQIDPPAYFTVALRAIEAALGVRYPPTAPRLLTELSTVVGTPKHHFLFERAHLLVTVADVTAPQDELGNRLIDGYLLPFMLDDQGQWPDIYGFDMADPVLERIAVFSVHTIVEDWASPTDFLHWIRTFVPPNRPPT
ncbi:MAG: hypothetical protein ACYC26_00885 [Phycisphaerales bacterium]